MIILYGIPNCDSVKRARAWLTEQGLGYEFHDFKKAGVPQPELQQWLQALGWERVLNRAGTTWRKLDDATKARAQDATSVAALLCEHPSAIKRPLVRWSSGQYSVGFDAAQFALLAAGAATH
ncbi:ArsC family reductase [Roseateles sp. BYS180W]|uniref:ArsC family reductase n=1 Tax=Roseateles rivi TaxID=3299028 RepID=A0ABW7FXY7_9BURK